MAENLAPYFFSGRLPISTLESQPIGSAYSRFIIKDFENDAYTFELVGQKVLRWTFDENHHAVSTEEPSDNFVLVGNEIRSTKVFDYDADGYLASQIVTIRVVDPRGAERTKDFVINVGDIPETFYSFSTSFTGTQGSDTIHGNRKAEVIHGLDGVDTIYGEGGNDRLYGGNSTDTLYGGAGDDMLWGGSGIALLYGGAGADRFVFKAVEDARREAYSTIFDFSLKDRDRIDLSFMDADVTQEGRQDFHFIGKASYSGEAGELRYQKLTSGMFIAADVDGDRQTDFMVRIDGVNEVTKGFFIL